MFLVLQSGPCRAYSEDHEVGRMSLAFPLHCSAAVCRQTPQPRKQLGGPRSYSAFWPPEVCCIEWDPHRLLVRLGVLMTSPENGGNSVSEFAVFRGSKPKAQSAAIPFGALS